MSKQLVIDIKDEMMVTWFKMMFEKELEENRETISNEKLFEKGSDGESAELHHENVLRLMEYGNILLKAVNDLS